MQVLHFFVFIYSIVALNILHSVTASTNLSSFASLWFSIFDSPSFLINNILISLKFQFAADFPMF